MAIPTPTRDPLLQHMFAYLNPRRDALPSHIVETIAGEQLSFSPFRTKYLKNHAQETLHFL
jgi:hypothetical protein